MHLMNDSMSKYILCCNWISTKLEEERIVEILDLEKQESLKFNEGLDIVHTNKREEYPDFIMISPEIKSWRLIVGCQLMYP